MSICIHLYTRIRIPEDESRPFTSRAASSQAKSQGFRRFDSRFVFVAYSFLGKVFFPHLGFPLLFTVLEERK